MEGINVNGIGRNPYADSYLTSGKNRSNITSKDTFVNTMNKVDGSKNSAGTSNVKYPGGMKNDPEYENYVLNRVRSAYSVQGLPVGSNNVGFDVIGASPEECYGYAGPVGKSGSETANDGESWWKKRHERMEELMKEQEEEAVKRAQARRKAVQNEYLNSQLAAAAYEKSSIILPDNPVIQ